MRRVSYRLVRIKNKDFRWCSMLPGGHDQSSIIPREPYFNPDVLFQEASCMRIGTPALCSSNQNETQR